MDTAPRDGTPILAARMPNLSRRGFLGCLTGIIAAPMIVKIDALMPVKVIKPYVPEMAFTIEKTTIGAKSVWLKAYYMELAADLKSVHGIDVETILREEINRPTILHTRKNGSTIGLR
jgi:hypothetical protein